MTTTKKMDTAKSTDEKAGFAAPKPSPVVTEQEAPTDIDGRTAEEIVAAAEPERKFDRTIGEAKEDQERLRLLTDEAQNNAGGIQSDAPTLEATHAEALESVARSHMNQNSGFAGAIGNQMASNPSHPGAAKTVADVQTRVRHISEFTDPNDPYLGHPDQVRGLK